MPTRQRLVVAVCSAAIATVLSGCITGERPTLVSDPVGQIDDAATLAVLDRLERAEAAEFSATYRIIPSTTGQATEATVSVAGDRRRTVIGNVEYVVDGGVERTCHDGPDGCVDFLDDARISDLNITNEFWGAAFAARLRLDATRRLGFTAGRALEISGEPAACVDIPLPGIDSEAANVTYCALDRGPLARYFGADVSIELTSFTIGGDPSI